MRLKGLKVDINHARFMKQKKLTMLGARVIDMNSDEIKKIAEIIGLEHKFIKDTVCMPEPYGKGNFIFEPDTNWQHTGMVLEWLEEKCVRHEWSISINRDYSTETTHQVIVRSECFDIVVKGEGSTLQEAICEAAYQVIKGE